MKTTRASLSAALVRLVVAVLVLAGCASAPPPTEGLASLVAAERAFARMSVARGMHPAFIENLAPDAIGFTPLPARMRDDFLAQPAPRDPTAITLDWAPVIAGIAASGDFGYTHGPFAMTDHRGGRPPRHGLFFSVWQRDATGRWKVAIDAGVRTPEPVAPSSIAAFPSPVAPVGAPDSVDALLARERGPGALSAAAYAALLAPGVRLLRDQQIPLVGDAAIADAQHSAIALKPQGGAIARSGDLAYTYGTLAETRTDGAAHEGGYAHLWIRGTDGAWRIAIVVRPG